MAIDNRRIITWSLNSSRQEYQDDLEKYYHKIYSIGLHEFGVTAEGKIYDFGSGTNYFDAQGIHTGVRFGIENENHMIEYPSIKWFAQMVLFGWSKVKPVLDNVVVNPEGRLPQDQFVFELKKILDIYEGSRNSGMPLNLAGVEMDVEASMTNDYVSQGNDVNYIRFLEKVKNEVIIPRELKMRVNAHAMIGHDAYYYYRFHNYKLFAESGDMNGNATIDEIQLMTYDFAWNGSAAGASTPIWWFKEVGDWCTQNFDPEVNPNAKLTIDNLFFGAAAYGHRWGMHNQEVVKRGSTITFRNLLGWINGEYKHYYSEESETGWTNPDTGEKYTDAWGNISTTRYVYNDQNYLSVASNQDEESKNEVMYPHVYDIFKPKYAEIKEQDGGSRTATAATYSGTEYAASNFKLQMPIWTNVHDAARIPSSVTGKAFALAPATDGLDNSYPPHYPALREYDPNLDPDSVDFRHLVKTVDGNDEVFVGYHTVDRRYFPSSDETVCLFEEAEHGQIEWTVNVPVAGNYKIVGLTNFSWYTQSKFAGTINGVSYSYGGDALPEWYPYFVKGSHWAEVGTFSLAAGANTITVSSTPSIQYTPIYGFVVCDNFDQNFSGGELDFNTNIQPMVKKDGTQSAIPTTLALAAKMLRRDARPALLWDDEFRTYGEGAKISGQTYYRSVEQGYRIEGGGTNIGTNENGNAVCYSDPKPVGYTQGHWTQKDRALHFDSDEVENLASSGQLILSKQWSVNLSIEARIRIESGRNAGIRFYAQSEGTVADGYIFRVDMEKGVYELVLEDFGTGESNVIASQQMGNVSYGSNFNLRVLLHNGVGHFFVGKVQAFIEGDGNPVTHNGSVDTTTGEVTLQRTQGACGIFASNVKMYCSHLGISTTDRWETLEKFEVSVDGTTKKFGQIARTGYNYDEFGYLIYSGLNEVEDTRDVGEEMAVSLDYEMEVFDWASWQGGKIVTIKFRDAGVWFGELLVGDKEGMSIIWAGDAWSFLDAMNMAVNDYGAKGIGLWTMGQEDPTLFELVPDVVPKV